MPLLGQSLARKRKRETDSKQQQPQSREGKRRRRQPLTVEVVNEFSWHQRLVFYKAGHPSPCEPNRYISSYRTVLVYFAPIHSQSLVSSASPGLSLLGSFLETNALLRLLALVERFCDEPTSTLAVAVLFFDRVVAAASTPPSLPTSSARPLATPAASKPSVPRLFDEPAKAVEAPERKQQRQRPGRKQRKQQEQQQQQLPGRTFGRDITNTASVDATQSFARVGATATRASTAARAAAAAKAKAEAKAATRHSEILSAPSTSATSGSGALVTLPSPHSLRQAAMRSAIHAKLRDKRGVGHILATSILLASKWLDDIPYRTKYFAQAGNLTTAEICTLEAQLFELLGHSLCFTQYEYTRKYADVYASFFKQP